MAALNFTKPGGCNYCNERRVWNDSQGDLTWRGLSRWLIEQVTQGQNSWKQTWELLSLCSLSKLRMCGQKAVSKHCNERQKSFVQSSSNQLVDLHHVGLRWGWTYRKTASASWWQWLWQQPSPPFLERIPGIREANSRKRGLPVCRVTVLSHNCALLHVCVFVRSCCTSKIRQTGLFIYINYENLFLIVVAAGNSKTKMTTDLGFGEICCLFWRWCHLLVFL